VEKIHAFNLRIRLFKMIWGTETKLQSQIFGIGVPKVTFFINLASKNKLSCSKFLDLESSHRNFDLKGMNREFC
jgi:hypothetical protein